MRSTFRILFYLKRNAPKSNGLVPVMCRITVNGKISQFSCKLDVDEKHWDVKTGRMTGISVVALEANRMLDKIRVGINKAYQDICDKDNYVTAEKVRNAFLGMGMNHETLLAVFRQHNEDYAKQVGKIKSQRSYWKYCTVYNHLSEFIRQRYKVSDIALKELAPAFITDFELFLRTEKNHCTNTIWSYMMPFKRIIYMSALQWTGNAIDLVEMIYGISEMGCINNGNIQLNELAPVLYAFFGVNSKDCYRFYTDIKRRKNDSRTYFIDKMQARLNEKMQRDDELERMRR